MTSVKIKCSEDECTSFLNVHEITAFSKEELSKDRQKCIGHQTAYQLLETQSSWLYLHASGTTEKKVNIDRIGDKEECWFCKALGKHMCSNAFDYLQLFMEKGVWRKGW